jgi:glycosyltransferase involved in cell wall biosynthesis
MGTGAPQADGGAAHETISVIMPMYNAKHHLPLVLKPLLAMLERGELAEVLVVDDVSTDDSIAVARELGATVLTSPRNGGPGAARNIGSAQAKGDILWFVDSDVIAHEDGARRVKAAFKDPGTVAVFGSYDDTPPAQNFMSQYKNLVHHYYHQLGREDASTFWAGCGAIRKRAFDEVKGYDVQRYTKPSIEDIELGYRLRARGGRIRLVHDLRCTHLKMWTLKGVIVTDVFMRAIPWSRLMISQGGLTNDLNVSTAERWRAILAGLLVLSPFAAVLRPDLAWLPIVMLGVVFFANRQFFEFLRRRKGLAFAILGTLFHQVYYLYSSAAFAWCLLEARLGIAKKAAATE